MRKRELWGSVNLELVVFSCFNGLRIAHLASTPSLIQQWKVNKYIYLGKLKLYVYFAGEILFKSLYFQLHNISDNMALISTTFINYSSVNKLRSKLYYPMDNIAN